jgi:hypothetical protein
MGPAEFEPLLLQGQCTIEDKTTRTGEATHWMPLLSLRPHFKPISRQTNLDLPCFAFCSPPPASLAQLDSTLASIFNSWEIQFLRCPEGNEYSAHIPMTEEPGKFLLSLVRYARPIAEKAGDVAP